MTALTAFERAERIGRKFLMASVFFKYFRLRVDSLKTASATDGPWNFRATPWDRAVMYHSTESPFIR